MISHAASAMKTLALEFSSARRSVAVLDSLSGPPPFSAGATPLGTPPHCPTAVGMDPEGGGRQTNAFALIESALAQAGAQREEIECLAIGIGPGSYTGIRAAIAIAQGWQLARGVKTVGISSIECMAVQLQNEPGLDSVSIIVDAQRGEFYLATYRLSREECHEAEPLRLATAADVRSLLAAGTHVAGPDATRYFPEARNLFPDAATLAHLASSRTEFPPCEKIEPIYLREISFVKAPPLRVLPT